MHVMQAVLQRGQSAGPGNVVQTYFAAAGIIRLALAGKVSRSWGASEASTGGRIRGPGGRSYISDGARRGDGATGSGGKGAETVVRSIAGHRDRN